MTDTVRTSDTSAENGKSNEPVPGTGHAGQTFLVGDNVYLRAIEPADAKRGQSLRGERFPRGTDNHEKWIKETLPEEERSATYVILRKADDVPVGSLTTERWDPMTFADAQVDPIYGERGQGWLAEAFSLALPWLVDEQHRPLARITLRADQTAVIAALERLGARQVSRFRETYIGPGGRVDQLLYEYLNREWVERIGDPNETALPRTGTGEARPVPAPVVLDGDPPKNAVRAGERVYLRPFEKADADLVATWSRQETEPFWSSGRFLRSGVGFAHWTDNLQKKDPQEWIRFAVCLRENDDLIGGVGLDEIDYLNGYAESESEINRPGYRGGGYGTEAKHLLFDYAFNTLGLHALQSFVLFPNTRSAAALRKQGYREAGRVNWWIFGEGGMTNFACFDLLAAEWRAMPRANPDRASELQQRTAS